MDDKTRYILALGAFRQQSALWVASAQQLAQAAAAADPAGTAPDEPAVTAVFAELLSQLQELVARVPGIRQLFASAIGARH